MAVKDLALKILITARDSASRVVSGVRGAIDQIGQSAARAAASIARIGAGIVAVGAAAGTWVLGSLLARSASEAEALDRQMRTIEAAIAATGGAAGITAEQIDTLARALDEDTLGSAAAFREGAAVLLTFKSIAGESYEEVLRLAQGLEEVGLGSFKDNVLQLAKALEDPVQGLTALRRSGVTFSKSQQEVIKSLAETGRVAEAQGLILEAVAGQVGGVARAAGGGLSGLRDLAAKLGQDLRDQLGAGLLAPLARIQEGINGVLRSLAESGIAERVGSAIGGALERAASGIQSLLARIDIDAVGARIEATLARAGEAARGFVAGFSATIETFSAWGSGVVRAIDFARAAWLNFRRAVELGAALITGALALVAEGWARIVEAAASVGIASEQSAARARNAADSLADATRRAAEASARHWKEAGEALASAVGPAKQVGDALGEVERSATLSAGEVDRLAQAARNLIASQKTTTQATEAAGKAHGAAAVQIDAQRAATDKLKSALSELEAAQRALDQAQAPAAATPDAAVADVFIALREASASLSESDPQRAIGEITDGLNTLRQVVERDGSSTAIERLEERLRALAEEAKAALGAVSDAVDSTAQAEAAGAVAEQARAKVEQALAKPIQIPALDIEPAAEAAARAAAAIIVREIRTALANTTFVVPVTPEITGAGGSADAIALEAAKRGSGNR